MRFLVIAVAATLLSLPAAVPANACGGAAMHAAKAATASYSAATKKTAKMKKEKVEYMRAVPSEPPKSK
jgi:outer membrane lipoprotein-sorting protein